MDNLSHGQDLGGNEGVAQVGDERLIGVDDQVDPGIDVCILKGGFGSGGTENGVSGTYACQAALCGG